jgi:hypothetical protein
MHIQWFESIPADGVLCKCKNSKDGMYFKFDVITRYNDRPQSMFKFKNNDMFFPGYEVAIPVTAAEAANLSFMELLDV